MPHFHVIRWSQVKMGAGESVAVPDLDFASLATALEAEGVTRQVSASGVRAATYACRESSCTLHAARGAREPALSGC